MKPDTQVALILFIRKSVRLLKYFIVFGIAMVLIQITVAYWLLTTRWKAFVTTEQMKRYAAEVSAAPPAPEKFKEVYTMIFPKHVDATMSEQLFFNYAYRYFYPRTDRDSKPYCYCSLVSDVQEGQNEEVDALEWDSRMRELEYGFGIAKFSSPEKCFDYVVNHQIAYAKQRLDTVRHRNLVFKDVNNYTDEEVIEMILLLSSKFKMDRYSKHKDFEELYTRYRERVILKRIEHQANLE